MNEFCDEKDLYRTTFLVKKREKKKKMCFSVNPVEGGPGKGI